MPVTPPEPCWWEVLIGGEAIQEERLVPLLGEAGCRACVRIDPEDGRMQIRAYFQRRRIDRVGLEALRVALEGSALDAGVNPPEFEFALVDGPNLTDGVKVSPDPIPAGEHFSIVSPLAPAVPDDSKRMPLRLEHGMTFGRGTHPSTRLCIEALERNLRPLFRLGNAEVLLGGASGPSALTVADIGCGSGILALAASLLGTGHVWAVDIDPLCVADALRNRDLNGIGPDRMTVVEGSAGRLLPLIDRPVDGFVVNIRSEVILQQLSELHAISHDGTWGILGGVRTSEVTQVEGAFQENGWGTIAVQSRSGWSCLCVRRAATHARAGGVEILGPNQE